MALTKDKKNEVVAEVAELLQSSKLTVVAQYTGTTVKAMQTLRKQANETNTTIKVVKNRLVKQAISRVDALKSSDTNCLKDQLLYAFNSEDEVAPAQVLNTFAKTEPSIQFVGAITEDGTFINAEGVKALANLPNKEQLRGILAGTIAAPLTGFANVLAGNIRGVFNVLNARAETI